MKLLLIDEPAPGVVRVLLNRPDKRNAIDHAMRQALIDAFDDIAAGSAHRAVVFGGTGGVFSAGGDIPSMVGLDDAGARERLRHGHRLARRVATLPLPLVTAIEGVAAGACLGLACLGDTIIAGRSARLLFPFMQLGLIPDWGILHSLPRRVGPATARRLLLQARTLTGAEAAGIGLVDDAADDAEVMTLALQRAQELAALPLHAFAHMKSILAGASATLEETLYAEEGAQSACLQHAEFAEGFAARSGKQPPDFIRALRKR